MSYSRHTDTTLDAAIAHCSRAITDQLHAGHTVLWLVSGGSTIPFVVAVRDILGDLTTATGTLSVGLIDERFGPAGHDASNWHQLQLAGFNFDGVTPLPLLPQSTTDITNVTTSYADTITSAMQNAQFCIGVLGIGTDGHTAGLLPHSSALDSTEIYAHYEGPDYMRITATPPLLAALDELIVVAKGREKLPALDALEAPGSPAEIPGRLLKQHQQVTIYSIVE